MGKKSNIKEDKDWTVEDMVEYVITGKKPKVKLLAIQLNAKNVPLG